MNEAWAKKGKGFTLADAISVLLLVWNQGFYRYGRLNFTKFDKAIKKNKPLLAKFRKRKIASFTAKDETTIKKLFNDLLEATSIKTRKQKKKMVSPVSVAKALHMMAPRFFPLWDGAIAVGWGCRFNRDNAADKYLKFMRQNKELMGKYSGRGLTLKMIDECSYAIYTAGWYPR
ncbi:MAG: hypothetical protein KAW41_00940 [Candidatus Diapherotrites archaeon]|nr:hypothetical protein [Candidatus Diapherotrites archaeon]